MKKNARRPSPVKLATLLIMSGLLIVIALLIFFFIGLRNRSGSERGKQPKAYAAADRTGAFRPLRE